MLQSLEMRAPQYLLAWFLAIFANLDYEMKNSVLVISLRKSQFSLSLKKSGEFESSFYFNLWCSGFIGLNGGLIYSIYFWFCKFLIIKVTTLVGFPHGAFYACCSSSISLEFINKLYVFIWINNFPSGSNGIRTQRSLI